MKINGEVYTAEKIAGLMDFAILNPDTDEAKIREGCEIAKQYKVKGVHANIVWCGLIADLLEGTDIETGIPIAFPFGAAPKELKALEAKEMMKIIKGRPGCIDMVTNVGKLKGRDYAYYTEEISEIVKIGHDNGYEVKSILEVALLTDEEVATATKCAVEAGVDLVKTSTGRNGSPQIKHVKIMKENCPPNVGVKFAGYGGYNPTQLTLMAFAAGATRLGTRRAPEIYDEIKRYYTDIEING